MIRLLKERAEMIEKVCRIQEVVSEISISLQYQFLPVTEFGNFWCLIFKMGDNIKTLDFGLLYNKIFIYIKINSNES